MSDKTSETALNYNVTPRALYLANEINRQCDQVLAIIAEIRTNLDAWSSKLRDENADTRAHPATLGYKVDDLSAHRADTEAHPRWQVREPSP